MKTTLAVLIAFGLAIILNSTPTSAQDLGDLARVTREKRMKVKQERSVRVWTNDNMPKRPAGEGPTAAAGMSVAPPPQDEETGALPPAETGSTPPPPAAGDDKKKTKEHWQQLFKPARQRLADMEEQQRLAEDELSLLRIQQARELSPDGQGQLEAKAKAASAEVEAKRLETDKARKELQKLEKEFTDSGAPADWSKID